MYDRAKGRLMGDMIIRYKTVGKIGILEVDGNDGCEKPSVIICHGYRSRKENMLTQAYAISAHGMRAVIPDLHMHGERYPGSGSIDIFEVVDRTVAELDLLAEAYGRGKVAFAGYSMGGFAVYAYIAADPKKADAAAAVISTPDWSELMRSDEGREYFEKQGISPDSEKMDELLHYAEKNQPLSNYKGMAGCPLLMINVEDDPVIPVNGPRKLYERLAPFYQDTNDIVLSIYKGNSHRSDWDMDEETAVWLKNRLIGSRDE